MERINDYDWVKQHLTVEEYIVWQGKPERGDLLTKQDIFLIPFSPVSYTHLDVYKRQALLSEPVGCTGNGKKSVGGQREQIAQKIDCFI